VSQEQLTRAWAFSPSCLARRQGVQAPLYKARTQPGFPGRPCSFLAPSTTTIRAGFHGAAMLSIGPLRKSGKTPISLRQKKSPTVTPLKPFGPKRFVSRHEQNSSLPFVTPLDVFTIRRRLATVDPGSVNPPYAREKLTTATPYFPLTTLVNPRYETRKDLAPGWVHQFTSIRTNVFQRSAANRHLRAVPCHQNQGLTQQQLNGAHVGPGFH
jgi:hypothetical protein